MNWFRRSGMMDEAYTKRAKKRPIALPPSVEKLIPPPTPTQASGSPAMPPPVTPAAAADLLSPQNELMYELDGIMSAASQGIAASPAVNSPATAAAAVPPFPARDPASPASTGSNNNNNTTQKGATAAAASQWVRPTSGDVIDLSNRSAEAREQLRVSQRRSYKAQMRLKDPIVAVRLPEWEAADDPAGGAVGDDDIHNNRSGSGSRNNSASRDDVRFSAEDGVDNGSVSTLTTAASARSRSKANHSNTHNNPRPLPEALKAKATRTIRRAADGRPYTSEREPVNLLARLCTTGITLLDYVEGVLELRVQQYQRLVDDIPVGRVVDPYVPDPNSPASPRGSSDDADASSSSPTRRSANPELDGWSAPADAVYYHPRPFTYAELVENPKLMAPLRRRELRAATRRHRTYSAELYGGPARYAVNEENRRCAAPTPAPLPSLPSPSPRERRATTTGTFGGGAARGAAAGRGEAATQPPSPRSPRQSTIAPSPSSATEGRRINSTISRKGNSAASPTQFTSPRAAAAASSVLVGDNNEERNTIANDKGSCGSSSSSGRLGMRANGHVNSSSSNSNNSSSNSVHVRPGDGAGGASGVTGRQRKAVAALPSA